MGKEEKKNTKKLVLYCLTSKVSFGAGTVLNHCRMHVYPLIRHGCGGQLGGLDRYSAASLVVLLGQQRSEHGCNAVPIDLSMTTYSDACRPAPPSCWVKSARCNSQPVSMWDRPRSGTLPHVPLYVPRIQNIPNKLEERVRTRMVMTGRKTRTILTSSVCNTSW
jgi:hypothetical protein